MAKPEPCWYSDTGLTWGQFTVATSVAQKALSNAYQPYSKYRVGCGLICADGSFFGGCNVETANHDGTHAEEAALAAMVTAGRRDPVLCICLAAPEDSEPAYVMPCGKCRQALFEFASLNGGDLWIAFDGNVGSAPKTTFVQLSDLLPCPFGPRDLGIDLTKYRRG